MNNIILTFALFTASFYSLAQCSACSYETAFDASHCYNDLNGDHNDIDFFKVYIGGNFLERVDINTPSIDISSLYNGSSSLTIQYYKNHWLWGDTYLGTGVVHVTHENPSVNVIPYHVPCAGESFNVETYPFGGTLTHTIPTSNVTTFLSTHTFTTPETNPTGSYSMTYVYETNGCTFTGQGGTIITEKPQITWTPQFPNTNQILDSDNNPINLLATSTGTSTLEYNGAGITGSYITPSGAGYGTHLLTAIATSQHGCKDTATQTIEITHDAGTPYAPQIRIPSSGVITSQGFFASQLTPTTGPLSSQEYSEMHVCDGQTITISVGNPTQISLDSIRYIYNNNGVFDTIGTYKLNNSTITYEIPLTGVARTDYIISQFKTNLGVYGSAGNTPVFVTAVEPTTPLSTLVCDDEFNFYVIEQDQGVQYQPFISPYQNGSLNGGNDWIDNYTTYTTRLTDFSNNNLPYTLSNTQGTYSIQAPKTKTITRTVSTKVPYNASGNNDIYSLVSNPQTCVFTDTIVISRNPIVGYGYSGDSLIIGGTTVTVSDSSLLSSYTTFDFLNGKGEQQGTSITDTLYSGQGTLVVTAYDSLGCSSDSLVNLVSVTNDPSIGLLDNQTSGLIYPVASGLIALSGGTDSLNSELHVCDGQTISLQIDTNKLAFSNGIDSVKYFYYANGSYDTIGKFGVTETVNYTIPTTNNKRIDSVYTQLFTALDYAGEIMVSPLFISHIVPQVQTTQILNCDPTLVYTDYIGQQTQDFDGLMHWSYQGTNADFTTFETVFKDVYGQILFNSGNYFDHSLLTSEKVDTIFKQEITNLPFRNSSNNAYYNAIANPQTCIYDDTIVIVRPPIASFNHTAQPNITFGTGVSYTSTSQYDDDIKWNFHDGSGIYTGETMYHYIYNIGSHDVSMYAYDDFGCADTMTIVGYTSVIDWTGIEEENVISEVKSYPNPMQDNLTLKITSAEAVEVSVFILDMSGKVALEKTINLANYENIINLDVSMLSSGVYNCQIVGKNLKVSQKLIKK